MTVETVHTLINTVAVIPERQDAVTACLRDFTEAHARSQPGFIAASVHASADGKRVVNYAQWRMGADLAAMLATPAARQHMAEVGTLAVAVDPVVYVVACWRSRCWGTGRTVGRSRRSATITTCRAIRRQPRASV